MSNWNKKNKLKAKKEVEEPAEKKIEFKKEYDPLSVVANYWHCDGCDKNTIAIELVCGVTPFMIKCPLCDEGFAQSAFYPKFPHQENFKVVNQATHEWYRPELKDVHKIEMEHILNGGLVMRKKGTAWPITHGQSVIGNKLQRDACTGTSDGLTYARLIEIDKHVKETSS